MAPHSPRWPKAPGYSKTQKLRVQQWPRGAAQRRPLASLDSFQAPPARTPPRSPTKSAARWRRPRVPLKMAILRSSVRRIIQSPARLERAQERVENTRVCGEHTSVWRTRGCVENTRVCGEHAGVWRTHERVENTRACGEHEPVCRLMPEHRHESMHRCQRQQHHEATSTTRPSAPSSHTQHHHPKQPPPPPP